MRILLITPSYYPATYFGGPIFSTLGLCNALAQISNVKLRVLTTDTLGATSIDRIEHTGFPVSFEAGYKVYYCRKVFGADVSIQMLRHLWEMVRWADVVHLTGVYSLPTIPTLLVCRLLGRPVMWSPRGSLQRWEKTKRPMLKRLWESVCNVLIRPGKVILHVTSAEEGKSSCLRIPKADVAVISNGVELPELNLARQWQPDGNIRLLYLGRLDPIKGIENLLQAIANLMHANVQLVIYGEGESNYVTHLKSLVSSMALDLRVCFKGHVAGLAKQAAFSTADVCVVPSFTENFGMVVAEALAHGVPVVVSRGAPWEGVEAHGCGLWVDNTPDELARALMEIQKMDLPEMGRRGRAWMKENYSWQRRAEEMHALYRNLMAN